MTKHETDGTFSIEHFMIDDNYGSALVDADNRVMSAALFTTEGDRVAAEGFFTAATAYAFLRDCDRLDGINLPTLSEVKSEFKKISRAIDDTANDERIINQIVTRSRTPSKAKTYGTNIELRRKYS